MLSWSINRGCIFTDLVILLLDLLIEIPHNIERVCGGTR